MHGRIGFVSVRNGAASNRHDGLRTFGPLTCGDAEPGERSPLTCGYPRGLTDAPLARSCIFMHDA